MQQKIFSKFIFSLLILCIAVFSFIPAKQARAQYAVDVVGSWQLDIIKAVMAKEPTAKLSFNEVFKKNIKKIK